ncbi:MAG TPA: TetR family transcriptional regulator [Pseudonocardiaceae bacterium]|nr:TetR family transcriptional regulator [Pseudonocardiaceae bacterium]
MRSTEPVPYPEAARGLLRDTIIDAVDTLARSRGWPATTMSQVAEVAGVSRQTVYNEFGSRQTLVEAYVTREVESLVAEVETAVREHADDPSAALLAAFGLFLKLASDEPIIRIIVADAESSHLMRLLTNLGTSLADDRIARLITDVWPQAGAEDAELIADSLVRLAISHAVAPAADPETTSRKVTRLVGPLIKEILG